jgi:hypothetical protein
MPRSHIIESLGGQPREQLALDSKEQPGSEDAKIRISPSAFRTRHHSFSPELDMILDRH